MSILVKLFVFVLYTGTTLVTWFGRKLVRNRTSNAPVQAICIGSFYNDGWLEAHARPLTLARRVERVYVITDAPLESIEGVTFHCPSPRMQRYLGRSLSRLITAISLGRRLPNPWFIGYHIMPNSLISATAAAMVGGNSAFQLTGGPVQLQGGGHGSENKVLLRMRTPSRMVEWAAHRLTRQLDLVVVRGMDALDYVHNVVGHGNALIITAAIDPERFTPSSPTNADIDVIYIGRLAQVKGADYVVEAARRLCAQRPETLIAMIGDGPERPRIEAMINEYMLRDNVRLYGKQADVVPFLQRSKLFLLLSDSEGMSIAMLESLMAGVPVVVVDVGELRSVVDPSGGGRVLDSREPEAVATVILELLADPAVLDAMSRRAREYAIATFSPKQIALSWDTKLTSAG